MTAWTSRVIEATAVVERAPVAALAALLDSALAEPAEGDPLPPLWHWVALSQWTPSSHLGADGHRVDDDLLPPVNLPRRMFAGGELTVHDELRVGATVTTSSEVTAVTEKRGRSGQFVLVQVLKKVRDAPTGALLLVERQDLVFRPGVAARVTSPADVAVSAPQGSPLQPNGDGWQFHTDPTLLMRFSAASANAHRIHYDWPYATRVEGYPGLVVHGPLSTLVLAEALHRRYSQRVLRFRHRNLAPLYCAERAFVSLTTHTPNLAEANLSTDEGRPLAVLSAEFDSTTERHHK